jgi:glycosyltransferase involved in cell wall biosynthesis
MPSVLAKCPSARLVIAGRRDDQGYERELRERVQSLGLAKKVTFALDLSEEDKLALLRSARVITLPSPIEGFGIVLLEAAAQGTPAVVSDGVPEEVIREGCNGLRVPFGDKKALAAGLASALTSDELHASLVHGAVENARRYTADALTARLNEVVRKAVAVAAPGLVAVAP